ncbi:MAG: aldo/keto reductase [Candidatus Saccharimonadales bacterium]
MVPKIKLNDGNEIPQIGLGLWEVKDKSEFDTAFKTANKAGYTHFDTAQSYGNELFFGQVLQQVNIKRRDIWITTKIDVKHFGHEHTLKSFDKSLEKLQTDYVDLLLLHFPVSVLRKRSWQALEEIQATGRAKSIGVSNYTVRHLKELAKYSKVTPAINQVELHVFLQQPELLDYCRANDIAVEAYSPLAHARDMNDPVVAEIAKKYSKSYAQIMLRWCLQKDLIILPKSITPSRIKENIDILDFEISKEDLRQLAKLDKGLRTCWDPTNIP